MQLTDGKLKFLTVLGVVLLFVLLLVLITLIAQSVQLKSKEKNLQEQLSQLENIRDELGEKTSDGSYRMTMEKIEEYLRENEGMIDVDDIVWKPAERKIYEKTQQSSFFEIYSIRTRAKLFDSIERYKRDCGIDEIVYRNFFFIYFFRQEPQYQVVLFVFGRAVFGKRDLSYRHSYFTQSGKETK